MAPDIDLEAVLRERYGILHTDLESSDAGTDSRTWWVSIDDVRCYVATWVADGAVGSLAAGVQAAAVAERSGVVTGAAVEALGGDRVLLVDGGSLVLVHHLEGTQVDDPATIGRILARVHAATVGHESALGLRWPWVEPARLADHPDLQQAVASALDDVLALGPLVTGVVHADPSPETFLRLDDGRDGLVDWSGAMVG
ncbi:MAG: aminoglycoside phosphotransferase, partial [Nocardioides sp.]|nr:aminoglycoside phosphotransferase [Nocardioides sp.]